MGDVSENRAGAKALSRHELGVWEEEPEGQRGREVHVSGGPEPRCQVGETESPSRWRDTFSPRTRQRAAGGIPTHAHSWKSLLIQASDSQESFLPSIGPRRILFDSKVGGSFQGPEREEGEEAGLSVAWGPITKATWAGGPLAARGSRTARKMPVFREGLINLLSPLPGNGLVGSRRVCFLAQLCGQ